MPRYFSRKPNISCSTAEKVEEKSDILKSVKFPQIKKPIQKADITNNYIKVSLIEGIRCY